MTPLFSVIIPSHNRIDVLPEVLEALEDQEGAPDFEVIVVDDGSIDGTADWLARRKFNVAARVLTQENRGPAAARNAGAAVASGRWVAFLGDDTVPSPGWLRTHREAHRARKDELGLVVIGYTSWHPRLRATHFLRYINEYGLQFGYSLIEDPENVPFNFFYTSNLSISREILLSERFDLGFPYPAWEDIELSYRLSKRGARLVYEKRAAVYHDHFTDLERFAARQEKAGYSAVVFYRRHPELGAFLGIGPDGPPPLPSRRWQRWSKTLADALQNWPVELPRLWTKVLRYHYIQGLERGWREQAGEVIAENS